jgi:hypothetical protein
MREYYRWEKRYPFGTKLAHDALSRWLDERERLWGDLEAAPFECLPLNGDCYDPFDAAAVNTALLPHGLVYSAGYGPYAMPHFFLGSLSRLEQREGFTLLVSAAEYARDLTAPPAMMQGRTMFIRRESFRRMLWERYEEWSWKREEGAMARAVSHYDFAGDIDAALDAMTDTEIEAAILHEIGEGRAGERLGPQWRELVLALARSKTELVARAVRDHLADCLSTLPVLVEHRNAASIDFYFANLRGMRKHLFPALYRGYQDWVDSGSPARLEAIVRTGEAHWTALGEQMLALFRQRGTDCQEAIETLADSSRL